MNDPNGWQEIATAPKDETAVMLYFPNRYQGKGGISWGCFIRGEWLDSLGCRDNSATHWQHLPLPPDPGYWERRQALKERRSDIE